MGAPLVLNVGIFTGLSYYTAQIVYFFSTDFFRKISKKFISLFKSQKTQRETVSLLDIINLQNIDKK